jgi:hypothetical protein
MIAAGIDTGYHSTEATVFDNEKGILGYSIIPTGGVAKDIGVVNAREEKLETPLVIYAAPQIFGSLGAAWLTWCGL